MRVLLSQVCVFRCYGCWMDSSLTLSLQPICAVLASIRLPEELTKLERTFFTLGGSLPLIVGGLLSMS